MTQEPFAHEALVGFDRLPPDEARLIEALTVHRWFDPDVIAYTAARLDVDMTAERLADSPFVGFDPVRHSLPGGEQRYRVRPILKTALEARMREARLSAFRRAHRIAADYYHQPLDPLHADRLSWYVHEVRHLAAARPEQATERLAAFAHDALIAGYAEAAGRAADALVGGESTEAEDLSLARIIQAVAEILSEPSQVERAMVLRLADLLARYGTHADPAADRLVGLARDLVVYYTEPPAQVTPLTAQVVPDATAVVDPRGMPVLGGELRLLEALAQPSRTITMRTQRVELLSSALAQHHVVTKLASANQAGRTMVLADLLPADRGERLDTLRLTERGMRPVNVLGASETVRALARGVGRLLGAGEEAAGTSSRAELSHRLGVLGWRTGPDELHDLLLRTQQSDEVEVYLQDRIGDVMRYTPVVALLDVFPGLSSEVGYEYQESCTTRRDGWGRVVVSVTFMLPMEVRNRVEFVTPAGLEAAGVLQRSGPALTPVHREADASGLQEFDLRDGRSSERNEDDGMARIEVDLGYRLTDREFRDVRMTALLCMALSAFALLLMAASTTVVSVIGTVLASLGVLVDVSRDRTHREDEEPLHVYAAKRMRLVRQSTAALAITAVAAPNAQNLIGSLIASGVAFLYCLVTLVAVTVIRRTADRPLSPRGRAALTSSG
ncbi:hypothetical protein ACPXCS_17935 [Streptomyces sp. DT190]|uniref:hypothetical protein n=1 Tax=unclassified Streptomyces TaxID=2593676 RepID=UPI003CE85F62